MLKILLGIFGLFLLVVVLIALTLFGCFRKKTPGKKNVDSELELLFPGKFQVLNSNLKVLDIKAQFKGEKLAVIGDKADPEVQFLLDWQKGTESAGFDSSTVIAAHERAKKEVAQARELFKPLKANGLENFSIGIIHDILCLQVFAEPTPKQRAHTLEVLKSVVPASPDGAYSRCSIELLEPAEFHHRYQDIIPAGHWQTEAGVQGEEKILTLNFEVGAGMDIPALMRHWEINTGAKRLSQIQDAAFKTAQTWAEKNLPKPVFMAAEDYVSIKTLESDDPAIRFGFPYYDKNLSAEEKLNSENEAKGYVTGIYYFDRKEFTSLKKQTEF